jgi:hypothetical protein
MIKRIYESKLPDEIYSFLNDLTTDDVGTQQFGNYIVKFEGFTDMCWADAEKCGKSIEDLEKEILSQWQNEVGLWEYNPIEHGWVGDIFYSIYKAR